MNAGPNAVPSTDNYSAPDCERDDLATLVLEAHRSVLTHRAYARDLATLALERLSCARRRVSLAWLDSPGAEWRVGYAWRDLEEAALFWTRAQCEWRKARRAIEARSELDERIDGVAATEPAPARLD